MQIMTIALLREKMILIQISQHMEIKKSFPVNIYHNGRMELKNMHNHFDILFFILFYYIETAGKRKSRVAPKKIVIAVDDWHRLCRNL
jgi:hypothetical protein